MQRSFAWRIGVAVALLVGFYAAALMVALGSIAVVVLQWTPNGPRSIWSSLLYGAVAIVILGMFRPPCLRPSASPGPLLEPQRAPKLHRLVGDVAAVARQDPPDRIHLVPGMDVAVVQRGGLLGTGGKRVMVIGLPLIDVLTVRQLRAAVAHDLGHFHGGDARLGPWFLRTYDAHERAVIALGETGSIWRRPFAWYFDRYLRRTAALRRRQEFLADELAARIAGASAAIEWLEAVPAAEGADPYRTRPSLDERVAALERLPEAGLPAAPGDHEPALTLIGDVDGLERELAPSPA